MATGCMPPIGGYILTGQLIIRHAAHAPVILRHDLPTAFFGIEEREADWPDFHSFNVFPISAATLTRLRELIEDDPRFEIDTRHSAFGWIPRPKVFSSQLGLPVTQPFLFATLEERRAFMDTLPARIRQPPCPASRAP